MQISFSLAKGKIDAVCGIESRGFLFGLHCHSFGSSFILVRKKGKLPPPIISEAYDLEYVSAVIEMCEGQLKPGQRVLIHDDLLATGGTTEAAAKLVKKQGGIVSQFSF
ncbi:adenine phosphoribosyltransferase [Bergeyella porcorum]|uniref:adenine phosphoribosyltransferase n=1 Tax=Bergeyella porcorum TaxID=1735111 RepID=A0AAU0F1C4_9FLAO